MIKYIVTLFAAMTLGLSGCASMNDVKINREFEETVRAHDTNQMLKVANQSNAIAATSTFECPEGMDSTACMLAKVLVKGEATRAIASLDTKEYKGSRGKTSIDVQLKSVDTISKGIPFMTMGAVSIKSIDADRGSVTNTNNGDGTINNSYEENHSVAASKEGNATASTNSQVSGEEEESVENEEGVQEEQESEEVQEESQEE